MKGFILLIAGLLLFPVHKAGAQRLTVSEHLSLDDGLSHPSVSAVLRDRQGFLWIGTIDGLNRYDGYEMTVFRSSGDSTSLTSNYVNLQTLHEDAQGYLWIGTRAGLNRYDPRTGRFVHYRHVEADSCSLQHDFIMAVLVARDETLWVGTAEGLQRYDAADECFVRPQRSDEVRTASLLEDRQGVLWIGTEQGLQTYDPGIDAVVPFAERFLKEADALAQVLTTAFVYDLVEDDKGDLWIGTSDHGLFMVDASRRTVRQFRHDPHDPGSLPGNPVLAVHAGSEGKIWVGTYEDGLASLDPETGRFLRYNSRPGDAKELASAQITSFVEDPAGVLWVGTWRGVNRLSPPSPFRLLTADSTGPGQLSHPEISAVAQDESGALWVGTREGGLNRVDPLSGMIASFRHDAREDESLSSDRVSSVWIDPQGAVWVSTFSGLNRFNPQTQTFTRYRHDPNDPHSLNTDRLYSVYGDHTGAIWSGTVGSGLNRWDPQTQHFTHFRHDPKDPHSLSWDMVWPLFEDQKETLWVGTLGGGLNRWDPQTQHFTHFRHDPKDPYSLSHDQVVSINEDAEGNLWIGTMGGGLNRFDNSTERFYRYTTNDGLPDHNVACILPDEAGYLWISTNNGLARFDPESKQFRTYNADDGLPNALFSFNACHKHRDGTLYLGSFSGLVRFRPEDVKLNTQPPPVVLIDFELFNESVRLDTSITHLQQITLDHDENFVGFRFAALDFTKPSKNRYAYRLEGVDRDWVQAGDRRYVSYAALEPGIYTFRVIASNNDGIWNENGVSLRLIIAPPYWQTWWFRLFLAALASGLLTIVYRSRLHQRRRIERTRQRIADDLHDDIGSKIGSLAMFLDFVSKKGRLEDEDRLQLQDHAFSARRLVQDLRDTVWIVDAGQDHLPALIERMEQIAKRILPTCVVRFEAPADVPTVSLNMAWRRSVFLIYKEALHNAARHAQATEVDVRIALEENMMTLSVEDNGVGFEVETVRQGRGLQTLRTRAEQVGGTLTIESRVGEGTAVRLQAQLN